MNKNLLRTGIFFCLLSFFSLSINAQLPNGSTAPEWELQDLDGNTWNLYNLLDQGKTVYIDFSATWCGPCWNYHNTHALRDVYDNHGPGGTNEAMVFFIEGDLGTSEACLYGPTNCTGGTQGNWVANTTYPIINLTQSNGPNVANDYQIGYWPTIYVICPNKKVYESGQASYNTQKTYIQSCGLAIDNIVSNTVTCYEDMDGYVDLTSSGGYGNISYSWSNGSSTEDLNNVSAGTYSVTVTEGNGLEVEGTATIDGPTEEFVAEIDNFVDVLCFGDNNGEIDVNAAGGTAGYSYNWSTGSTSDKISNLSPGTYDLTLTDGNNCEIYETYSISDPAELTASATTSPDACGQQNGEIIVNASGGTGALTYDIGNGPQTSPIFSNLSTGIYNITVVDENSCSSSFATTVAEILPPVVDVPQGIQTIPCDQTNFIIDGTGSESGPDIQYIWTTTNGNIVAGENSPAVIVDQAGDYNLAVINVLYNCVSTDDVTVQLDPNAPVSDAGPSKLIECSSPTVQLDGTGSSVGGQFSYAWTTSDGNIVSGANTLTPIVDAAGTYSLEVSKNNGDCVANDNTSVTEDTSFPTAVADSDGNLDCGSTSVTLSSQGSSSGNDFVYSWVDSDGNEIGTTSEVTVSNADVYTLIVTNITNGCASQEDVEVIEDIDPPTAEAGNSEELTCTITQERLDGSNSSSGSGFTYQWTTNDGNIVSDADKVNPLVDEPGTYYITVFNENNECSSIDSVLVTENINTPVSDFEVSQNNLEVDLTATASGNPTSYAWDFGDGNTSAVQNPSHTYASSGVYNICLTITNECGTDTECSEVSATSGEINVSTTIKHVSCHNGSDGAINLEVSGVIEIETYAWSNGAETEDISGLEAGSYMVTMTSKQGQEFVFTYTISQPEPILMDDIAITDLTCYEDGSGKINPEIIGGVEPYNYEWSDGSDSKVLNNVQAGSYSLTVTDDNDCITEFGPYTIKGQAEIIVENVNVTNPRCYETADGSISLDASGGVGTLDFEWSNGETGTKIENLSGGEFSLELTDENGCVETFGPYEVNRPDSIKAVVAEIDQVSCYEESDGRINLDVSGGTGEISANWSDGSSEIDRENLDADIYTVEFTDANGCINVFGPYTITQPEELVASVTTDDETGSIVLSVTGGTEPYKYIWNDGSTDKDREGLQDGFYSVEITDANGCIISILEIKVGTVDINSVDDMISFNIYPNPVSDVLLIEGEFTTSMKFEMTIQDVNGKILSTDKVSGNIIQFQKNMNNFAAGYYILKLKSDEGVISRKVIKH